MKNNALMISDNEKALFQEWRSVRPGLILDGVVDMNAYRESDKKLMFVLDEPKSDLKKYTDMRKYLKDGGSTHPTWGIIAMWAYGIRHLDQDMAWKDVYPFDVEKGVYGFSREDRTQYLRSICVMCVSKVPIGGDEDKFYSIVTEDGFYLGKQFSLYEPDLVILCGERVCNVSDVLMETVTQSQQTRRGVYYSCLGENKYRLDYEDPARRTMANLLYYGLIDAVCEILKDD